MKKLHIIFAIFIASSLLNGCLSPKDGGDTPTPVPTKTCTCLGIKDAKGTDVVKYTVNDKGLNIKTENFEKNGSLSQYYLYTYNNLGQEVKTEYYSKNNTTVQYVKRLEYDIKNRLIKSTFFNSSDIITRIIKFEYDSKDREIKWLYLDAQGNQTIAIRFEYPTENTQKIYIQQVKQGIPEYLAEEHIFENSIPKVKLTNPIQGLRYINSKEYDINKILISETKNLYTFNTDNLIVKNQESYTYFFGNNMSETQSTTTIREYNCQ